VKFDEDESDDKLLDITQETDLVTNVRDILDELNIVSCVIFEQKPVLEDMGKMPLPSAQQKKRHPLGYVEKVLASVNKMKQDARREYSEVCFGLSIWSSRCLTRNVVERSSGSQTETGQRCGGCSSPTRER
jgi:hypothetical protein